MNKRVVVSLAYICFCAFLMWMFYILSRNIVACLIVFLLFTLIFFIFNISTVEQKREKIIYDMSESEILAKVKVYDENFSKDNFYIFVKNIIYFFYDALMGENLDKIKNIVSEPVYNSLKDIVLSDKNNSLERFVIDLEIKGVVFKNYYIKDNYEYVEVLTDYRFNEFTLSQETKKVDDIGDYRYKKYVYTFYRKVGSQSKVISYKDNCPGCGANNCNFVMGVCVRCGCMIGNYGDFILESVVGVNDE